MIQNIIVILIVAAAVIYVVRSVYKSIKGKEGCGSCSSTDCPLAGKMMKKTSGNGQKSRKPSCCSKKD